VSYIYRYKLDPEERTLETISSGNTASTVISHYDASGGAVAWTGEGSGEKEKWTRNIPSIDGTLTAIQKGEGKTGKSVVLLLHDLKGDVVGEAAISETETKLLKSYNSTEFGVPSGKEAPPKYAWLGAAGVSGELPSGVITQDGVTYVPQTGRPLQTEGVPLPAPENAATPFTRPFEEWVGSKAGEGAARELSAAEQEKHEREIANQPPGEIPFTPPSWWCSIEAGTCGGEEGCDGDAGPCEGEDPGDLYKAGCRVWTTIHFSSGLSNSVYGLGYFECYSPAINFELQVCVQEETSTVDNEGQVIESSYPNGKFANYGGSSACTKGDYFSDKATGKIEASAGCENPAKSENYRSWVWGHTWFEGLFNYTGWAVSDVRWSGPSCEPTTHGPGTE
jgi:hypothetical protein